MVAKRYLALSIVSIIIIFILPFAILAHEEETEDQTEDHMAEPETIYHKILDNIMIILVIIAIILVILTAFYYFRSKKPKISKIITYWIALGILLGLGYSAVYYLESGVIERGLIICENTNDNTKECSLAIHIHADMDGSICGEVLKLPLQKGDPLTEPHTHTERNKIHWEGKLKVDKNTKEVIDKTPLKIGTFMDVMGVRFNDKCLGDKCNGDPCNDKVGKLVMLVNGMPNTEYREYVWKDGDRFILKFE